MLPQNACGVGQNTCGVGVGFVCMGREEGRAGRGREQARKEKEEKEGGQGGKEALGREGAVR